MQRWEGHTAFVTGASSGIGAAIAESFVKHGMTVVGFARRVEKIEALAKELSEHRGKLYAVKGDVSKEDDVKAAFAWVEDNLNSAVHVLVNNAAVAYEDSLSDGNTEDWKRTLDTNVLGLSICTREALRSMKDHGFDDGHIFNINSIFGHVVLLHTMPLYTASKFAVTALSESLRKELSAKKSRIRVTNISPGLVKTEMTVNMGVPEDMLGVALLPSDIADGVVYALSTRQQIHIPELTMASCL